MFKDNWFRTNRRDEYSLRKNSILVVSNLSIKCLFNRVKILNWQFGTGKSALEHNIIYFEHSINILLWVFESINDFSNQEINAH
jgi:hypothetical protein